MVILNIKIENITIVLEAYDQIKVYRSTSEDGSYSEISTESTRIDITLSKTVYTYYDQTGSDSNWYKTSYYNSETFDESPLSSAIRGCSKSNKIGYTFGNYTPPKGEWGEVLTPDDMRFTYLWGIDLKASDIQISTVSDEQLRWCVSAALELFEEDFNIDIRKRIYKVDTNGLTRARNWKDGVDFTDYEEPYDFKFDQWQNFGFVQLKHKPIISIETAWVQDVLGSNVLDVKDWIRLYRKAGQIHIYPKGSFSLGRGYSGSGIFAAWNNLFRTDYPQGIKIEYTTGLESSDFLSHGLRDAIGMAASLALLAWVGDGLFAGFSSSSISLDGLSESFSSTQSATSAYFGARIKDYSDRLKEYRKSNKAKHANISLGFA